MPGSRSEILKSVPTIANVTATRRHHSSNADPRCGFAAQAHHTRYRAVQCWHAWSLRQKQQSEECVHSCDGIIRLAMPDRGGVGAGTLRNRRFPQRRMVTVMCSHVLLEKALSRLGLHKAIFRRNDQHAEIGVRNYCQTPAHSSDASQVGGYGESVLLQQRVSDSTSHGRLQCDWRRVIREDRQTGAAYHTGVEVFRQPCAKIHLCFSLPAVFYSSSLPFLRAE
jgi:hypothetical protein